MRDIQIEERYIRQAQELHRKNLVVDAHLDLAGEVLLRHMAGEKDVVKNYYLSHFKAAGINLIVSSIYVENGELDHAWENALLQIRALKEDVRELDEVKVVYSSKELQRVMADGKIAVLLYMEGLDAIGEDIDKINELFYLGVRGASLTWSRPNALAVGCCTATKHVQISGRITELGIRAVKRLEELSMFLDVSHLNDEGYEQLLGVAEKPFIATHSNSRYVYDNFRNMTDAQMRALAAQGGVIGVNGCKYIAGSVRGNHIEMLCTHIEHELEQIGAEHVGFGFDLCDSYGRARAALKGMPMDEQEDCLLHHGQVPYVTATLLQRGVPQEEVCRIIGANFVDYFVKGIL